jgi:galactose oxidase-like protein/Calx-beta domain-containing protein/Kelch motif protein
MRKTHYSCRFGALISLGIVVLSLGMPRRAQAQSVTDPGRWDGPYDVGVRSVHLAVDHDGHVLGYNSGGPSAVMTAVVWDPVAKSVLQRPLSAASRFCGGMAIMDNGKLIIVGGETGSDANGNPIGIDNGEIFDHDTGTWSTVPDMPGGERWYPSAITLADARVLVWSGTSRGVKNPWVDAYDRASNTWTTLSSRSYADLYPRLHVMLSGEVFVSGGAEPLLFDPISRTWKGAPAPNVQNRGEGMCSVLLPYSATATTQKVLVAGGGATSGTNTAEVFTFNASQGAVGWTSIPSMSKGRKNFSAVLLPDGEVLALGGSFLPPWTNLASCEVYNPASNSWRTVAPLNTARGYHAGGVLLPDGSVLAGGGEIEDDTGSTVLQRFTTFEIYKPWYFNATRPTISSAPATAGYGGTIAIGTPSANIAKVVLIRTSSTTHGLNTDQRAVELPFSVSGGTITAQMPATSRLAPPGDYMLFLRDSNSVPSLGRFVKVNSSPPPPPPPTVSVSATDAAASEAGPNAGTFTLSRTGSTSSALTVNFVLSGTATNGTDYAAIGTSRTIAAGQSSATVTVTPIVDAAVEGAETVVLTLSTNAAYIVGSPSNATVTIADSSSAGGSVPPPWGDLDIGSVPIAGSAGYSNGTFDVCGAGGLWGTSDTFHFAYQTLNGDGEIAVRVLNVQNSAPYAKTGVMIRETLAADSAYAAILITPSPNGGYFTWRASTAGPTADAGTPAAAPVWVKLSRVGDLFTASVSPDGTTWTQAGTQTIPMTSSVVIGLAVTSSTNAALNCSSFDSVTGTGGWPVGGGSGGTSSGAGGGGGGCGLTGIEAILLMAFLGARRRIRS